MSVRMYALPEYEPPRQPVPPDPDAPDESPGRRPVLVPVAAFRPPANGPVWDEPGEVRERLLRLLTMVLEVLDGRRQAALLRTVVAPAVYESLCTRSREPALPGRRHRLRSLHTCRPVPGVVELCATVMISVPDGGTRVIAFAGRVVVRDGALLCTVLRPLFGNTGRARR